MERQVKESIKEWITPADIELWIGFTLTMKQKHNNQMLDNIIASKNTRHFINVLNRKVFGRHFRKRKQSVGIVPVLEGSADKRFHLHGIAKVPPNYDRSEFVRLIDESWSRTDFGYRDSHYHQNIDQRWIGYILKLWNNADEVDLGNVIPPATV